MKCRLVCKCGREMHYSWMHDAYVCKCGNVVKREELISGDFIKKKEGA